MTEFDAAQSMFTALIGIASHVAGCALSFYAKVEYDTPATRGAATSAATFSRSAFRAGEIDKEEFEERRILNA